MKVWVPLAWTVPCCGRVRNDVGQLWREPPKKHRHRGGHEHRWNDRHDQNPVDVASSSVHGQVRK